MAKENKDMNKILGIDAIISSTTKNDDDRDNWNSLENGGIVEYGDWETTGKLSIGMIAYEGTWFWQHNKKLSIEKISKELGIDSLESVNALLDSRALYDDDGYCKYVIGLSRNDNQEGNVEYFNPESAPQGSLLAHTPNDSYSGGFRGKYNHKLLDEKKEHNGKYYHQFATFYPVDGSPISTVEEAYNYFGLDYPGGNVVENNTINLGIGWKNIKEIHLAKDAVVYDAYAVNVNPEATSIVIPINKGKITNITHTSVYIEVQHIDRVSGQDIPVKSKYKVSNVNAIHSMAHFFKDGGLADDNPIALTNLQPGMTNFDAIYFKEEQDTGKYSIGGLYNYKANPGELEFKKAYNDGLMFYWKTNPKAATKLIVFNNDTSTLNTLDNLGAFVL